MLTLDRVLGCVLGLSLGDAMGAPYEGGLLERTLWRMIGRTRRGEMRWTDDTQMSIDIMESFLSTGHVDSDDLARRFAMGYRWSRGYGPGAARVLKRIAAGADWRQANQSVYPDGSYGNGAGMRAPIIGLIHADEPDTLVRAARDSAIVTHAHPLGIEGALLLARATAGVAQNKENVQIVDELLATTTQNEFASRLTIAKKWLETGADVDRREVARALGNGIAASRSCVTAFYLGLRFREQPYETMLAFITRLGGDADTIGAMSGALRGVSNGETKLPANLLGSLEQREVPVHSPPLAPLSRLW